MAVSKSLEIIWQQEACEKQRLALEQQAGIRSSDLQYVSLPAYPTKANIRSAYFAVEDPALRRKLIAKYREWETLKTQWWQQEVYDANATLKRLETSIRQWWLFAALCGVGLVGVGYLIFAIPGAIAGALAGLFFGRAIESSDKHKRAAEVKDAEKNFSDAKSGLHEFTTEAATFSRSEEVFRKSGPTIGWR